MEFTWSELQVNLRVLLQCIKSIDLSAVRFIRQEVGDTVLINFTLLSTIYQSTPSVTHKNKSNYHNLKAMTKQNSHFTEVYCEVPVNQTWHPKKLLDKCTDRADASFRGTYTTLVTHIPVEESNQPVAIRNIERTELIWATTKGY